MECRKELLLLLLAKIKQIRPRRTSNRRWRNESPNWERLRYPVVFPVSTQFNQARNDGICEMITQVRDIESRAATVSWTPCEPVINESTEVSVKDLVDDISYEAAIGQKSGASKSPGSLEKCSYRGKECQFR